MSAAKGAATIMQDDRLAVWLTMATDILGLCHFFVSPQTYDVLIL